ncbi:MAG: hypothetical protein IPK70_09670 [Flavobacteriales bacterium]|jgi:hypothetical protein|nr:hypothetical protein [Flavobacteriales bacterium]
MRALVFPAFVAFNALSAQSPRVAHVLVALCDNEHQGIVKVPAGIGNGQNARTNLYWGAGYGVKTHFDRSADWLRVPCGAAIEPHILDRAVWKHRDSAVYIVADAYDGRHIREATVDLLRYSSGQGPRTVKAGGTTLHAGGNAALVAYLGHDGLMDFSIEERFTSSGHSSREAIILACISKRYFAEHLRATGADPLVWTTGLMAPEAYTLKAALDGWVLRENQERIRERSAAAYDKYQKCGINGARRLLVTGW